MDLRARDALGRLEWTGTLPALFDEAHVRREQRRAPGPDVLHGNLRRRRMYGREHESRHVDESVRRTIRLHRGQARRVEYVGGVRAAARTWATTSRGS